MYFAEIKDENLVREHLQNFARAIKIDVPREYFEQQGSHIGYFDQFGRLKGGYTLILKPEFRGLALLPAKVKETSAFVQNTPIDELMEVNGVWIAKDVKSAVARMRFWINMLMRIGTCGKKFMIIFHDPTVPHFKRLYSAWRPTEIFHGVPEVSESKGATHNLIYVGYCPTKHAFYAFLTGPAKYMLSKLSRSIRSRKVFKPA